MNLWLEIVLELMEKILLLSIVTGKHLKSRRFEEHEVTADQAKL